MNQSENMFVYVCFAALFTLVASSCENTPNADTLRERFCTADVAFYGRMVGGGSSANRGNGHIYVSAYFDFSVVNTLKGTVTGNSLRVMREHERGSPCDFRPFAISDHIVIFGSRSNAGVTIDECYFSPSWECVPDTFKLHYADRDFCG